MPIKDVSNARTMPRLGKIRLGIKMEPPDKSLREFRQRLEQSNEAGIAQA
ncbi:hypothetical protein LCGC14_1847780 [marine sediment metagenome]|uniref:Uncharacterized protein n=1 Tax=marine sediment metagenome TaxID=412755 RepID=A0A0F9GB70_9ZZZZ